MEVCSDTAADDDDALALRIEMVDVEDDDDAAAALQIAVNNVMSIRDSFIVFILLWMDGFTKQSVYLRTIVDGIVMVICFFHLFLLPSLKKIARNPLWYPPQSARDIKVEKIWWFRCRLWTSEGEEDVALSTYASAPLFSSQCVCSRLCSFWHFIF